MLPSFLSRCAAHPSSSLLPPKTRAWHHRYLFCLTTLPIIMFSKTALAFLALGILCVNALAVPVAREPSPEPERKFPDRFIPYHIISRSDLDLPQQSKISRPGSLPSSQPSRLGSQVPQRVHPSTYPNARFRASCSPGRLRSDTYKTSWPGSTSSPSRMDPVVCSLVSPRTGPNGPE